MFRRRRREGQPVDDELVEDEATGAGNVEDDDGDDRGDDGDGADDEELEPAEPVPTTGPWDVDDAPTDEPARVDLGGLRIPVLGDIELRVDVSPEGQLASATLVHGSSAMQVNAFAAPRTAGIWAEIRQEIVESLQGGGGSAEETEGPFGTELRARIPGEVPGQGRVLQPARFMGVDGPRWFVRALLSGPAATDPVQAEVLEAVFRQVVVVRGKDAMAPRDQIPLRLPREAAEVAEAAAAEGEAAAGHTHGDDLTKPERGPEIAETR